MSSYEVIKDLIRSKEFKGNYKYYLQGKDTTLSNFIDNIDLNKKYYRMNINKNKRYKKETTEDTSSIKEINSMINKITNTNYTILKDLIIKRITADHIIPYIIQKLTESSFIHHIYIPYYVGILKEIKSTKKQHILLRLCNKYHTDFFYTDKVVNNDYSYEELCSKNKNIDNIIGFSLFISHLEKEDIIDNFIEKVLDSYMNNLSSENEVELFKMLVSFESISKIHYQIIPERYTIILNDIKKETKSSKIKFKIMDILDE